MKLKHAIKQASSIDQLFKRAASWNFYHYEKPEEILVGLPTNDDFVHDVGRDILHSNHCLSVFMNAYGDIHETTLPSGIYSFIGHPEEIQHVMSGLHSEVKKCRETLSEEARDELMSKQVRRFERAIPSMTFFFRGFHLFAPYRNMKEKAKASMDYDGSIAEEAIQSSIELALATKIQLPDHLEIKDDIDLPRTVGLMAEPVLTGKTSRFSKRKHDHARAMNFTHYDIASQYVARNPQMEPMTHIFTDPVMSVETLLDQTKRNNEGSPTSDFIENHGDSLCRLAKKMDGGTLSFLLSATPQRDLDHTVHKLEEHYA